MRCFFSVLVQDLRRTVLSRLFLASVLGLAIVNVATLFDELQLILPDASNVSVLYLEMLMGYRNFYMMFLLFSALPGSTLFCHDWDNRYIRFSVMRSSKSIYAASKALTCFLSAVFTVVLAEWLTVLLFSFRFKLYVPDGINGSFGVYQPLITPSGVPLYLTAAFLCKGFCGGALSVFALWFSTKITNVLVTLAIPMLAYYLIQVICFAIRIVPSYLLIDNLTKALVIKGGPGTSLLYSLGIFVAFASLFGFLFVISCKRRISNG